jgi:ATP-dependent Clp protease adaptor protein ClpS
MATPTTVAPDRTTQVVKKTYPNYKVIVLNDDFNTFQHVASCLLKYIPDMTSDLAWSLTNQVHYEDRRSFGSAPKNRLNFTINNCVVKD